METPPAPRILEGRDLARSVTGPAGARELYRNVSLDAASGTMTWITGPSGSGKTLLLRSLARLEPPGAGLIRLDGVDTRSIPAVRYRSRVMYLHPQPAVYDGTLRDNLELFRSLAPHRARPVEEVEALAGEIGLPASRHGEDAAGLSTGERARLGLLRLLQLDPEVLLLDEPFAALDPTLAHRVAAVLGTWVHARSGRAVIGVAHLTGGALPPGSRGLTLSLEGLGPVEDVG